MNDVTGAIFACVGLLSLGLSFLYLYRLINPYARGRCGAAPEFLRCIGWLLLFALSLALGLPSVGAAPEAARRSECAMHLKAIMLAMQCYHDQYGCFPPAYTVDKAGRPLHSWRVLLPPYGCFGWAGSFEDIRFDDPFDSPHNRAIFQAAESDGMPYVFRCPSDDENHTDTNYVMLVGPRTLSNGPISIRLKDITDGDSETIVIVETYDLRIRWYEPRDLRMDEMSFRINDAEHYSIASRHPGGAQVAFVDGSVRYLSNETDVRAVEAAATIHGGEDEAGVLK